MILFTEEERAFIEKNRYADVRKLAFSISGQSIKNKSAVLDQISGRQIASAKLPSWASCPNIIYPPHLSMEQCSSEKTANYKANLISGYGNLNHFCDLTAGFGVDFTCITHSFQESVFVEKNKDLCEILEYNLPFLGIEKAKAVQGDALDYLRRMEPVDWIFIDPARRNNNGGKCIAVSDCTPDITSMISSFLKKSQHTLVKLSPMLDISLATKDLEEVSEIHVVSVNNECKELLLIIDHQQEYPPIHTINFTEKGIQRFVFTKKEETACSCKFCSEIKKFLYEPNASILKAGAFCCLTSYFPVEKLHPNSHLYTSDSLIKDFPGRVFQIEDICGFGKKEIKATLSGISKANVAVRNFPLNVQEIRQRTKLSDGGEWYLFATTMAPEKKILLKCKKA